jgi:excisionase family DNA binding protein
MTTITTGRAAKRLGVDISTIKRMIERGELRAQKIGAWFRVTEADVITLEKKAGGNP